VGIATLSPPAVMALTQQPLDRLQAPTAGLLASVSLYDQRGGGVDIAIKGAKHGLGMTKRKKKRCAAPQMGIPRHALAPNTMVGARHWRTPYVPTGKRWGIVRLVREVLHISGGLVCDHRRGLSHLVLNRAGPLSKGLITG
jgi:hypothetical protein